MLTGSHIALLGLHRGGSRPLWFLITKAILLLIILTEVIVFQAVKIRHHQNYVRHLREIGEICVSEELRGLLSEDIVEHHKPRHYDYGRLGVGDYCPSEDYPPNGLLHGML